MKNYKNITFSAIMLLLMIFAGQLIISIILLRIYEAIRTGKSAKK